MNLQRFLDAQDHGVWDQALAELRQGHKRTHWMWFILPQLRGLGFSINAQHYGLADLTEAKAYVAHPILGDRLLAACEALQDWTHIGAEAVLGDVDAIKLRSCLTLFAAVPNAPPIFAGLLRDYFDGVACTATMAAVS